MVSNRGLSASLRIALLCLVPILLAGCLSDVIAHEIIAPPRPKPAAKWQNVMDLLNLKPSKVQVGPPKAELCYWCIPPYPFCVFTTSSRDDAAVRTKEFGDKWGRLVYVEMWDKKLPQEPVRYVLAPQTANVSSRPSIRGTVLLMQGWSGGFRHSGAYLLQLAAALSNEGYRVIYVDLRGQGDSTGEHLGYGKLDAKDISQVIDDLQSRGLADSPIILIGHSYGAGAAIVAAADPRVKAVVSLSPYRSLRQELPEIRETAKLLKPLFYFFLNPWVTDDVWQKSVNKAGQLAGFNPDEIDPAIWISQTSAPVLLVHGKLDKNCPFSASQRILDARPGNTKLIAYDNADHWSYLSGDNFRKSVIDWLNTQFE
jgi:pimeloyl-ACP methyl ester carboxylesterase